MNYLGIIGAFFAAFFASSAFLRNGFHSVLGKILMVAPSTSFTFTMTECSHTSVAPDMADLEFSFDAVAETSELALSKAKAARTFVSGLVIAPERKDSPSAITLRGPKDFDVSLWEESPEAVPSSAQQKHQNNLRQYRAHSIYTMTVDESLEELPSLIKNMTFIEDVKLHVLTRYVSEAKRKEKKFDLRISLGEQMLENALLGYKVPFGFSFVTDFACEEERMGFTEEPKTRWHFLDSKPASQWQIQKAELLLTATLRCQFTMK